MRHQSFFTQTVLLLGIVGAGSVAQGSELSGMVSCRVTGDRMTVVLHSGNYALHEGPDGQYIEMVGFGDLGIPGRPRLPMKRFLIALPPDKRALSVEMLSAETVELPGRYEISPYPRILPVPDVPRLNDALRRMEDEWQTVYHTAYTADTPNPVQSTWLAGRGTFRQYSYAAVAFCPFTYRAESGGLSYHQQVELSIALEVQPYEQAAGYSDSRVQVDSPTREKAQALFANYASIAELYDAKTPRLAPSRETYDYIILTTSDLVGAVEASGFQLWKTAIGYNVRTVLVTDPEISGQPGIDLAEQIRNFLRTYYEPWGIEYVLIVGDYATVPMRICYPNPDYHVYNPSDPGLMAPGTPTDYYYADLSYPDAVSWDSDGDGYHGEYGEDAPDFLAEVSVGRIPVNSATRITYALDKLLTFEQDTEGWKSNVMHGGSILFFENQNNSGYPFIDGASCLDSIETGLMNGLPITHFTEQAGIVTSLFPWPQITEAAFTSSWGNNEYGIVNWSGHGWSDGAYRTVWQWDDGDGVPESGNGEMQSHRFIGTGAANLDDDHPSIVFAISCNVGYPDPNPYGNLGIDLLTLPGWGPSAGILSSSRPATISSDWTTYGGGTEQICYDFNRYLITESERVGDALYDGKFSATVNYGWDILYEYVNLYNYNLYGDPALERAGHAAALSLAAELISGEMVLTWNPVSSAQAYWLYGAANDPVFIPGFAPGYANRQAIIPSGTTTWSSPSGVGDASNDWTYLIIAVDASEVAMATSNRTGEIDYVGDIP